MTTPALKKAISKWRAKNKKKVKEMSKKWKENNDWKGYYQKWLEKNPDYHKNYYKSKKQKYENIKLRKS